MIISNQFMESALSYEQLIPCLRKAFQQDYHLPQRHHHFYPNPQEGCDSTLLLMPAWDNGQYMGVKIATVSPNNSKYSLPTIQGQYLLFDLPTGSIKAQMDAKLLTAKRTAATSALAASYLARTHAQTLLVIGTGTLSKELVLAHSAIRPISKVYIWGRNFEKAQAVVDQLDLPNIEIEAIADFNTVIQTVDIISCATLSPDPLIHGEIHLSPGQHYDMIGAYKPDMREADDDFITSVDIFVDSYAGASTETGDLAIPLKTGVIQKEDMIASLFELCDETKPGRVSENQITCFKSVGHALEDLAAAALVFKAYQAQPNPQP